MSHRFHPDPERDDATDAILFDDCATCSERATSLGLGLDGSSFARMWERMRQVEYHDEGAYLSANEKLLGRQLYYVTLLVQRYPIVTAGGRT